jgi:hypothetical protein
VPQHCLHGNQEERCYHSEVVTGKQVLSFVILVTSGDVGFNSKSWSFVSFLGKCESHF